MYIGTNFTIYGSEKECQFLIGNVYPVDNRGIHHHSVSVSIPYR